MVVAVSGMDSLGERAAKMKEALQKSQTITDSVVSILGSFDSRLSVLETALRPTQIRTHAIRKAHENIDKTLKTAEVILTQFDAYRQVQRRKRIEMAPLKSGWTGAVSASAREQNNVDMARQREPLLTGEFERANDLTAAGIELPPDTPDDQDELKKLKGSKSRDMVDDFKSGWTLLMTTLIFPHD